MRLISADDLHAAADAVPPGDSMETANDQLNLAPQALETFMRSSTFRPEGVPGAIFVPDPLSMVMGISIGILAERRRQEG